MSNRALREPPKKGLSIREWLLSPGRPVTRGELWNVLNVYHRSNRLHRRIGRMLVAFWRYLRRPVIDNAGRVEPPKEEA